MWLVVVGWKRGGRRSRIERYRKQRKLIGWYLVATEKQVSGVVRPVRSAFSVNQVHNRVRHGTNSVCCNLLVVDLVPELVVLLLADMIIRSVNDHILVTVIECQAAISNCRFALVEDFHQPVVQLGEMLVGSSRLLRLRWFRALVDVRRMFFPG